MSKVGPDGWNDDIGYGAHNVARPPFFVVTHRPPPAVRLDLDFTVVSGVAAAVDAARGVCHVTYSTTSRARV